MNIRQSQDSNESSVTNHTTPPVLIDFQWTGVGLGMLDVAMHLHHSVSVNTLGDHDIGQERHWIAFYHYELVQHLSEAKAAAYPLDLAHQHYGLCLLDYARIVIGRFWAGASFASFQDQAQNQNCGLPYRSVEAALRFVKAIQYQLTVWEGRVRRNGH